MEINDAIYNYVKSALASQNIQDNIDNQRENNEENIDNEENLLIVKNIQHFQGIMPGINETLLKMCIGNATNTQIEKWAYENNMTFEEANDIIPTLKEYCLNGYNMAKSLDVQDTNIETNTEIINTKHTENKQNIENTQKLLDRIEYLENVVNSLIDRVKILEGLKE